MGCELLFKKRYNPQLFAASARPAHREKWRKVLIFCII